MPVISGSAATARVGAARGALARARTPTVGMTV
jgi:hypothetical protein